MLEFIGGTLLPAVVMMDGAAAVIILLVLLCRLLLRRAPRIFSYALWAVVLFRLLCPVALEADVSVFRLLPTSGTELTTPPAALEEMRPDALPAPSAVSSEDAAPDAHFGASAGTGVSAAIAVVWLAGALGLMAYNLLTLRRLRRRLVGAMPMQGNVYLADGIATSFVMGLLRPKIYLPSGLAERERRYVLLHEKMHIRRGDHVFRALAFLALCMHWFDPLVWAAFVCSGQDMEQSCDEAVLQKMGTGIRTDYAATLLRLAAGPRRVVGLPLAFGQGDVKGRIVNMLKWKQPKIWVRLAAGGICAVMLAACAFDPPQSVESVSEPLTHTETEPAATPIPADGAQLQKPDTQADTPTADAPAPEAIPTPEAEPAAGTAAGPEQSQPETSSAAAPTDEPAEADTQQADIPANILRGDQALILSRGGTLLPDDDPESYVVIDGVAYKLFIAKGSSPMVKYMLYEYQVGNVDELEPFLHWTLDELVDGEYPRNSKGETYGINGLSSYVGYHPDLVRANGTNGETGYICQEDMLDIPQGLPDDECPHTFMIPLYNEEHEVIGQFEMGCGGHMAPGMTIEEAKAALAADDS